MGREGSPDDLDANFRKKRAGVGIPTAYLAGSEGVAEQAYRRENLASHIKVQ